MLTTATNQFDNSTMIGAPSLPPPQSPDHNVQSMEVGETANLKPRQSIRRDIPRYVVQAGDLLPDATKRNWKGLHGYQIGGMHFDLTEIPCLWKFSGFVTRARLTPLIKKPTMAFQAEEIAKKKQEQIAETISTGGEVRESPEAFRMVFPWDSLQSLKSDHIVRKGLVEVEALVGVEWELRVVQEIQKFFFPNWADIEAGKASLPFTVREFVAHIERQMSGTNESVLLSVGDAYLESAGRFKVYCEEVVQRAKDLAMRGANDNGYVAPVSPLARHLAAQIEVSVEAKQTVVVQQGGNAAAPVAAGVSADELELRRRELAAKEEELRIKRIELGLDPAPATKPAEAPAKPEPATGQSMENADVNPQIATANVGDATQEAGGPDAPNQFENTTVTVANTTEPNGGKTSRTKNR